MAVIYKKIETDDFRGEIVKDIVSGVCIKRPLFSVKQDVDDFPRANTFFIPDEKGRLIQFLFDLSLSKNITYVNRVYSPSIEGFKTNDRIYAYELYYGDSMDGRTNITPEFLESLNKLF